MLINILFGLLLPWVFGIWLYFKNPKVVLTIAPFRSAISFIVNIWGTYNKFWLFTPLLEPKTASMLPADIGLFPVVACFNIYFIQKNNSHLFFLFDSRFNYIRLLLSFKNEWNFGEVSAPHLTLLSLC